MISVSFGDRPLAGHVFAAILKTLAFRFGCVLILVALRQRDEVVLVEHEHVRDEDGWRGHECDQAEALRRERRERARTVPTSQQAQPLRERHMPQPMPNTMMPDSGT